MQLLVGADGPVQLLLADVAPGAHRVADGNNLELRHRAWVQPEDIHTGAELSGSVSLLPAFPGPEGWTGVYPDCERQVPWEALR